MQRIQHGDWPREQRHGVAGNSESGCERDVLPHAGHCSAHSARKCLQVFSPLQLVAVRVILKTSTMHANAGIAATCPLFKFYSGCCQAKSVPYHGDAMHDVLRLDCGAARQRTELSGEFQSRMYRSIDLLPEHLISVYDAVVLDGVPDFARVKYARCIEKVCVKTSEVTKHVYLCYYLWQQLGSDAIAKG